MPGSSTTFANSSFAAVIMATIYAAYYACGRQCRRPKSASLSEVTVDIGEREIDGKVLEKERARTIYKEEQERAKRSRLRPAVSGRRSPS